MPQLIHERRVELDGPRAASTLPPYNRSIVVPSRTFTRPKDYQMPIPQEIIDESKGIVVQNPNY